MTRGTRLAGAAGVLALTAGLGWVLFVGLPRWTRPVPPPEDLAVTRVPEPPPVAATPRIKARLFYLTADGMRLRPTEQEVEFGATATAQARRLTTSKSSRWSKSGSFNFSEALIGSATASRG